MKTDLVEQYNYYLITLCTLQHHHSSSTLVLGFFKFKVCSSSSFARHLENNDVGTLNIEAISYQEMNEMNSKAFFLSLGLFALFELAVTVIFISSK